MRHLFKSIFCLCAILFTGIESPFTQIVKNAETDYNQYFSNVKWRCIGPFRGGRSVAVSGVKGDKTTYYMGTTGGGLWKTEDIGLTWFNISDGFFTTGSVGAVSVAPNDPNVIYVGMGEHAVRGVMTHHGDGIYKSTDAGKTWKKMGLDKSQHISRIIIHPSNPEIVWVGVQGALYSSSEERGIYKTIDGGKTWQKSLYVNNNTGCAELSIDVNNPRILYAAMWEFGRKPWKVTSGGDGSGLFKSTDSGETWTKIQTGLPKELGKMAISVAPSNSKKVYALIESDSEKELGGLFFSENGGESWEKVSSDHRLIQRAWYYIEIFVDPKNENTIYVLSAPALRSLDGGKTWENIEGPHGDYHDLWINPDDPKNMIIADDGGASVSVNNGKTWSLQNNLPTAQIYRLNADNLFPYNVYAGQQDNTSFRLASRQQGSSGIDNTSLSYSAGGESAFLAFDPNNPRFVMGGSYLGTIEYFDAKNMAGTNVMPSPYQYLALEPNRMKYRYNWNAPVIWSQHEVNTYYHAAQVLLRTKNNGHIWEEVSPDLTKNEKSKQGKGGGPYTNEIVGAENYGTISYVIESPHEKGTIWVGSDDGLVHLTKDGCKTWKNVTPSFLSECLINAIEISPHDPATAYIATTRYKFNDHSPGLYKTNDYGKTWTAINQGIPGYAFTRVVREDPNKKDLLFAGSELGLFISWNGGIKWHSFQLNLPITPITDLKFHKGNLIAATSGRSIWILDDIFLFHQYSQNVNEVKIFRPPSTFLVSGSSELDGNTKNFNGSHYSRGVNPATGMVLYYFIPDSLKEHISIEIIDEKGRAVRKFTSLKDSLFLSYDGGPPAEPVLHKNKGLNRFVWNLRHTTFPGVANTYIEGSYKGHKAIPGKYTVILTTEKGISKSFAEILPNPGYPTTTEEYIRFDEIMSELEKKMTTMFLTINELFTKQKQLSEIISRLPMDKPYDSLRNEGNALIKKLITWDNKMIQRKSKAYDDVENFENKFTADYMFLINHTESEIPSINQPSLDRKKELDDLWFIYKSEAEHLLKTDLPALNKKCWESGIGALWK